MSNKNFNWNDITLLDYIDIQNIVSSDMDEISKTVELTKILSHNPNVDNLPLAEFNKEAMKLKILETSMPRVNIKKEYVLGGRKYKAITNIKDLCTGAYIDYCNLSKSAPTYETLAKFVAILLIPEGHKYNNGYDIEDVENDVLNYMSIVDVQSIGFFFKSCLYKLSKDLVDYSLKIIMMSEMTMREKIRIGVQMAKLRMKLKDLVNTVL